jgi:hypothetical protein
MNSKPMTQLKLPVPTMIAIHLVVVASLFIFASTALAQNTYTIRGEELVLQLKRFEDNDVVFVDETGTEVKVSLFRLSPAELQSLLSDVARAVLGKSSETPATLQADKERSWSMDGRTFRCKFVGVRPNEVIILEARTRWQINFTELRRSDALYVIRHLAPHLPELKIEPGEKPAGDADPGMPAGRGFAEHPGDAGVDDARGRTVIASPQHHAFVDVAIDWPAKRFLTVGGREIIWWDLDNGSELKTQVLSPGSQVWTASPAGKYAIERYSINKPGVGSLQRFIIWETRTKKQVYAPNFRMVLPVFSPDEKWIAFQTYKDGSNRDAILAEELGLTLVNLETKKSIEVGKIKGGYNSYAVCFSPDSKLVAATDRDGNCHVWSVKTGEQKLKIGEGKNPSIAFGPKSQLISVSHIFSHCVYDISTGKVVSQIETPGLRGMHFKTFAPNGRLLGGHDYTGDFFLWDRSTNQMNRWKAHNEPIRHIVFNPDSKSVITTESDADTVKVWDIDSKATVAEIRLPGKGGFPQVRISDDGSKLICFDARHLIIRDVDLLKKDYLLAKDKMEKTASGVVAGREGINKQWTSVLACIPKDVNSIIVFRPEHFLAGKDLAKNFEPRELAGAPAAVSSAIKPFHGYEYSRPSIIEQKLIGRFKIYYGHRGFDEVQFVQSSNEIGAEELYKEAVRKRNDFRVRHREYLGKMYVVGDNRPFAISMPDAKTVFIAENAKTIEKLIEQLAEPPTEFAKQVSRELESHQFLVIANEFESKSLVYGLPMRYPLEDEIKDLKEEAKLDLLDEFERHEIKFDALSQIKFKGRITDDPDVSFVLEMSDNKAATEAAAKLTFHLDRFQKTSKRNRSLLPQLLRVFLENKRVRHEGKTIFVELDKEKVPDMIEKLSD